ncbi:MAG: hypothetical protein OHK0015_00100 [Chloroflexi bacterium OHK40]
MDTAAATRLAGKLSTQQKSLCQYVAARLLRDYPELTRTLRLEENYQPAERLSEVAVERFSELVRSVLLFELPSLADRELTWAHGVLPRHGVTVQHQAAMVRWYFEELRRLPLSGPEQELTREIEQYMLAVVQQVHSRN